MQCEAQSVPCSSAAQAICNDAVRPKLASQMCMLFVNKPLDFLSVAAQGVSLFLMEIMMGFESLKPGLLLGSAVYALLGVLIFWLCFIVIDKLTPYNLWEEIVEKQNKALGMVVAAMSLGICIIVAAAIH